MKSESQLCKRVFTALVVFAAIPAFAQTGKLKLRVTPKQAYVFIEDRAISEASKNPTLNLTEGDHKVELVNYGYQPATKTVSITAGKTTELKLLWSRSPTRFPGPSAL
jgi:uncharacterized membrane protein